MNMSQKLYDMQRKILHLANLILYAFHTFRSCSGPSSAFQTSERKWLTHSLLKNQLVWNYCKNQFLSCFVERDLVFYRATISLNKIFKMMEKFLHLKEVIYNNSF